MAETDKLNEFGREPGFSKSVFEWFFALTVLICYIKFKIYTDTKSYFGKVCTLPIHGKNLKKIHYLKVHLQVGTNWPKSNCIIEKEIDILA